MFALSSLRKRPSSSSTVATDASETPSTFSQQHLLPRLPVPPLRQTLDTYLHSILPILQDRAAEREERRRKQWLEREIAKRQQWAAQFESGLGRVWQERLTAMFATLSIELTPADLDRASPNNWLDDNFWTGAAYLSWREPLPINSNWWCMFIDDPAVPEDVRASKPNGFTPWQIRRAASLTSRFLDFRDRIQREDIPPDKSRAGPFDMSQYKRIFGVTRIPARPEDRLLMRHDSRHIVMLARDQPYAVDVLDADGGMIDPSMINDRFAAVATDAARRDDVALQPAVGLLTALPRDAWTDAREHLLNLDSVNRSTCTAIEDALFVVALDDYTCEHEKWPPASCTSSDLLAVPLAQGTSSTHTLASHIRNSAIGSPTAPGRNRWFDKSIVLIVESNARAAVCGEHSPCDALIPAVVMDYVVASSKLADGAIDPVKPADHGWHALRWSTDDRTDACIADAAACAETLAYKSEAAVLWFDHFGVDWIRSHAKLPPDAFIQMAIQLAWRQLHGVGCATYETASTRSFLHGRTETIRTYSEHSRAFCEAAVTRETSDSKLFDLLKVATSTHHAATRAASLGQGCDRHLLGLRMLYRPEVDGPLPPLLADELFAASTDFRLSTSGLSAGDHFTGTGFGAPSPHGYGINYLAGAKVIKFGIESKWSTQQTSTEQFRLAIAKAMLRLRDICVAGQTATLSAAKL